jgi:hypothetical protein
MEEAILIYRDAYGISRFSGLSTGELKRQGVYLGDADFGFISACNLDTRSSKSDNPAARLYRALKDAGRKIEHSTFKDARKKRVFHCYSILKD